MSGNEAAWRLPEDMGAAELLRKLAGDLLLGDAALYDYLGYGHEGFWGAEKGGVSICRTLESLADMVERELLLVELCGLLGIAPMGLIDVSRQELAREFGKRVMPEGMEWPRFEDGEPVRFGDVVSDGYETGRVYYVTFDTVNPVIIGFTDERPDQDPGTWLEVSVSDGERVKRPAPKVLDADGAEIRVGDTVYDMVGDRHEVKGFGKQGDVLLEFHNDESLGWRPSNFTHRAPVLAADGKPLREGEHVYHVETGSELVVKELPKPGEYQAVVVFAPPASHLTSFDPDQLTHERPDSWERIEADCSKCCIEYCDEHGLLDAACNTAEGDASTRHCTDCGDSCEERMARDLVRRAKKLAGVER